MFTVYLLRHGAVKVQKGTFYGVTDYVLSGEGEEQVKKAASDLESANIDIILSSPLKRAVQSATIVSNQLHIPIREEKLLIEKSFGIFEGLTYEEIKNQYPGPFQLWEEDWYGYEMPGGESAASLHRRCIQMKNLILREKKNMLLVSHQGCIRYLISEMLNLGEKNMWRFSVNNGKIAKIIVNDEGFAYLEV
ncbi:MAG: histidine phosphatase family protein [Clostridia bacterium]|nr:histidine phosphatase family protein [Clostridia bacterium]